MEIWRAVIAAVASTISLMAIQLDIRAQNQPPLPTTIGASVPQEFREDKESSGTIAGASRTSVPKWRVLLTDPLAAHETRRALDRARVLLQQPACAAVLTDFTDREGRALAERVNALGKDAAGYLELMLFVDGARDELCTKGAMAFTAPGSRIVRVCATQVTRVSEVWRDYVAVALIHEMLHTLGLGENPPASHEITRRVRDRCGFD